MNEVFIPENIQIVYFSGTGGAQMVADEFTKQFSKLCVPVQCHAIDHSAAYLRMHASNPPFSGDSLTLLLYAVHAFDAPSPVYDWIDSTNFPEGARFAVVSVSGGGEVWPNTGCRSLVIKVLEKKGCTVQLDAMMVMPSNMNPAVNDDAAMWLINALPVKAEEIAKDILSGKNLRTKYKMDPFRAFATRQEKKNAHKFADTIKVKDTCTACGWCAQHCPQNNIRMESGKPTFLNKCVVCFRCIYGCPAHALESKNALVIQKGFDIAEVQKRMAGKTLRPIRECCRGVLWKGIVKYLKSAFPNG